MAGHKNQGNQENQEQQRLDEHLDNFQGELSEQDSNAIKEWADREAEKYKEQLQQQFQPVNATAERKKKNLSTEQQKKQKTFDNTKKRYQDFLKENKEALDHIHGELETLNQQEQKEADEKFKKEAPKINHKYDEKSASKKELLKQAQATTQLLKDVIEIKKNLEQIEKDREKVKYVEWGEYSWKTDETTGLQLRKVKQSAMGLKFNEDEQNENKKAYETKMAELTAQLKEIEKEKNSLATKMFNVFTGNKKKLAEQLEQKQNEISSEMKYFAEKQTVALSKESKLKSELKTSQDQLTDEMQKFRKDEETNNQLLEQKKQLEEKLKKLTEDQSEQNKKSFQLGTASQLEEFVPQGEDAIKKNENDLVKIEQDREKALKRAQKTILEECVLKNKEKHDDLDKQKKRLEQPLKEKELNMKVAEQAYQNDLANYDKNLLEIKQEAISNRTKHSSAYFNKLNALKDDQKKIEDRLKKYALLSRAIEELKQSPKQAGSNSAEFQTMINALESFSTLMHNPESKQTDLDHCCIDAIQACEDYVEKRSRDTFSFMRSDFGKYRINRANSISSALQKFSPAVTAHLNQQREHAATRVKVSLIDNSNQKLVKASPIDMPKSLEKTK